MLYDIFMFLLRSSIIYINKKEIKVLILNTKYFKSLSKCVFILYFRYTQIKKIIVVKITILLVVYEQTQQQIYVLTFYMLLCFWHTNYFSFENFFSLKGSLKSYTTIRFMYFKPRIHYTLSTF